MPSSQITIFVPVIYLKVNTTKLLMYFYIKSFESLKYNEKTSRSCSTTNEILDSQEKNRRQIQLETEAQREMWVISRIFKGKVVMKQEETT